MNLNLKEFFKNIFQFIQIFLLGQQQNSSERSEIQSISWNIDFFQFFARLS